MEHYRYKQAAVFTTEEEALQAQEMVSHAGLNDIQTFLLSPKDLAGDERRLEPEGDEVASTIVHKALEGAGVGAIAGAALSTGAGALQLALFMTHPVLATLAAIGYGSAIGAVGGALAGEKLGEDLFIGAVEDALKNGHWAVVVHAADEPTAHKVQSLWQGIEGLEQVVDNR